MVVLAGYAGRMDTFFKATPGMSSRIAHHITFADYDVGELEQIGLMMTKELGYHFSPDARETFRDYLDARLKQPWFANARSVCNAVGRARLRQARRLFTSKEPVGLEQLTTFEPARRRPNVGRLCVRHHSGP